MWQVFREWAGVSKDQERNSTGRSGFRHQEEKWHDQEAEQVQPNHEAVNMAHRFTQQQNLSSRRQLSSRDYMLLPLSSGTVSSSQSSLLNPLHSSLHLPQFLCRIVQVSWLALQPTQYWDDFGKDQPDQAHFPALKSLKVKSPSFEHRTQCILIYIKMSKCVLGVMRSTTRLQNRVLRDKHHGTYLLTG